MPTTGASRATAQHTWAQVPMREILMPISLAATKWLYCTEGCTDEQLRWTLLYTPVNVAGVVLGAAWSVTGVAVGFTVTSVIEGGSRLWFCLRRSRVNGRDVARAAGRPVLAAVAAALAAHQTPCPLTPPSWCSSRATARPGRRSGRAVIAGRHRAAGRGARQSRASGSMLGAVDEIVMRRA